MSGQSELGWGTPTPIVERFPALTHAVPTSKTDIPENVSSAATTTNNGSAIQRGRPGRT